VSRRRPLPAPAVIDACCLIDLLVSGLAGEILRANAFNWHLPIAVKDEVRYIRRYDPTQPGALINEPADLSPHLTSGLLTSCQPVDPPEEARFVHYAAQFRSDGEAMCLALAESRGWTVATDDRKATRIAAGAGLTVISCPQLVKAWADAGRPTQAVLAQVLADIETLAQFRPNSSMPESVWWFANRP
jgi:predicted nucleic acid-binding protein